MLARGCGAEILAISYANVRVINAAGGGGAVTVSAYAGRMIHVNEITGVRWDYTAKASDHVTTIVMLPLGANPELADPGKLWNAAERAELLKDKSAFRANAQLAKEIELALPKELDDAGRLELAREFVQEHFVRHGVAAQLSIHRPHDDGVNYHAHIIVTTRYVGPDGMGKKARELNPSFARGRIAEKDDWHLKWTAFQNAYFERHGIDLRVDAMAPVPGVHLGPARHIARSEREIADANAAAETRRLVLKNPEIVLDQIARTAATFTMADLAKAVNKFTESEPEFRDVFERAKGSARLIRLTGETHEGDGAHPPRYTTRAMIDLEAGMVRGARDLAAANGFALSHETIETAIRRFEAEKGFALSAEQRSAVEHITGEGRLASVVGLAGTGKSTMAEAARMAWEAEGYRVIGGALAGVAAENLAGSGIGDVRTLAAWEYAWKQRDLAQDLANGKITKAGLDSIRSRLEWRAIGDDPESAESAKRMLRELSTTTLAGGTKNWIRSWGAAQLDRLPAAPDKKTVLVIDEAGMIGARQFAGLIDRVERSGAKLVQIGDWEQLQSIEAGAAFRVISERVGFAELTGIRRQEVDWMRDATRDLSRGRTREAIGAYDREGHIATGIHLDAGAFVSAVEKETGILSPSDRARLATIGKYIEGRTAAGAIWAEAAGKPEGFQGQARAEMAPWRSQRDLHAREIANDIEGHRPWLQQLGVDGVALATDILVADGQSRASAAEGAHEYAAELGLGEIGKEGELTQPDLRSGARAQMTAAWHAATEKGDDTVMLAHTNRDVEALNVLAREHLRSDGKLSGPEIEISTTKGSRAFQVGDRVVFLENNKALGVRNGRLGRLEAIEFDGEQNPTLVIRPDQGRSEELVRVDPRKYSAIDHGNAITVHKSQALTVGRTFVLASPGMDKHMSYVAMSRHRYSTEMFAAAGDAPTARTLISKLEQAKSQDSTLDYAEARRLEPATLRQRLDDAWGRLNARMRGIFSRGGPELRLDRGQRPDRPTHALKPEAPTKLTPEQILSRVDTMRSERLAKDGPKRDMTPAELVAKLAEMRKQRNPTDGSAKNLSPDQLLAKVREMEAQRRAKQTPAPEKPSLKGPKLKGPGA